MPDYRIFVQYRFPSRHRWPSAKGKHGYLSNLHRHLFHVRVEWIVTNEDRQLEFLEQLDLVARYVEFVHNKQDCTEWSCETWARNIMEAVGAFRVEVSEDGENGAIAINSEYRNCNDATQRFF